VSGQDGAAVKRVLRLLDHRLGLRGRFVAVPIVGIVVVRPGWKLSLDDLERKLADRFSLHVEKPDARTVRPGDTLRDVVAGGDLLRDLIPLGNRQVEKEQVLRAFPARGPKARKSRAGAVNGRSVISRKGACSSYPPLTGSFSADRRSAIIVPAPRAVSPFAPAAEDRPWQVDQAIFAVFCRVPWQRRAR
jgi:hypothetical protein